jgi:hypothetical protein
MRHSGEVIASSLYEVAVLALKEFPSCYRLVPEGDEAKCRGLGTRLRRTRSLSGRSKAGSSHAGSPRVSRPFKTKLAQLLG